MIKVDKFYEDKFVLQTLQNSEIFIKSITFRNNKIINSIVYISASDILLDNITGINNSCIDCNGSVLTFYETNKLILQNSDFTQNSAINGGSISHIKCNNHQNYIFNTNFTSNYARGNGGAIYLEKCNLKLNNSNFTQNSALIGGAIRYKDFVPIFISEYRNSTNKINFIDNKGEIFGDNYGSYIGQIMIQFFESEIKIEKQRNQNNLENLFIREFSSGDYIEFYIEFFDEERKKMKFNPNYINLTSEIPESIRFELQKIIISLESYGDEILIEGSNIATFNKFEILKFSKIRLISQPTKVGTLQIKTGNDFETPKYLFDQIKTNLQMNNNNMNSKKDQWSEIIKKQIIIDLKIHFRECQRGEIYLKISQTKTSCYKCPLGTYSIVEPDYLKKQECIQCSSHNTKECGNNTIILADGFWRLNEYSDVIVQCTNRKENCKDTTNSIDYCAEGLIGPLCEMCDTQGKVWGTPYSNISEYQCAACNDNYKTYLRQIIIFIALNIYIFGSYYLFNQIGRQKAIVYYLKMVNMISFGNSARHDKSSTYLKFFITYTQLQSHINLFDQNIILIPIKSIFGFPITQINAAVDCQISFFQNIYFIRTISMILIPFAFYIWIWFVFFIYSIYIQQQKIFYKKLSSLILLSFISFQPNIVSFLIQSISCRQIGEQKYVVSDSRMTCFNNDHIYVILISIFGLLIWVGVVPIYIYRQLINIKNIEWITVQYQYGFFYIEYKKSKIYWEIVRIYTKLLVVLVVNILQEYTVTQFIFLSFTLFAYYYLTDYHSPYETNHMNKVDKYIVTSLSIQVLLNAVIKDLDDSNKLGLIFKIICFVFNFGTLVSLILITLIQKIKFFRNNIQQIKLRLSKFKCLKKIKFLKLNTLKETDFKRFFLWKKLSNNLHYAVSDCYKIKQQQIYNSFLQQEQILKQLNKNNNIAKKNISTFDNLQGSEQTIKRKFITHSSLFPSFNQKQIISPKIQQKRNTQSTLFIKSLNEISSNQISNQTLKQQTEDFQQNFIEIYDDQTQKNFQKSNLNITEDDRIEDYNKSIQFNQRTSPYNKILKQLPEHSIFQLRSDHFQLQKTIGDIQFQLDESSSNELTYNKKSTIN